MGRDIHAYVETKSPRASDDSDWSYLCDYRFSRNYALFALVAETHRYNGYPHPKALEEALAKRGVKRLDDPKLSKEEGETIMREGCDNGVTRGVPSFVEKGIPKDIDYKIVDEYTMFVTDGEDVDPEGKTCKRSQADAWVSGDSSEVWERDENGVVVRVTNPDYHSPSWLDAGEVRTLSIRFREMLMLTIPDAKELQAQCIRWAAAGLETAKKDEDPDQVAFFERELARESDWATHDPLSEHAFVMVEGLTALMDALAARGVKSRLVFWFAN